MKTTAWAAVPLTLFLCAITVAPSSAGSQEIVVTGSPREVALASWSQRVRDDLERKMGSPSALNGVVADGLVTVSFTCTESGRPDNVALLQSSGHNGLDKAALRSVRRLSSLHPMVEGMRPHQKVIAQMLYLDGTGSPAAIARRTQALDTKAREANQWFTREQIASGEILMLRAAR